ncbi:phosphatase PAP2 family protein, partial [uncultured Duncaniella sp.]
IGAYSVAVGVAFLRLYNGRHWLNDVIAGAGVGILSARIGYWMLPLYKRWFKWDSPCSDIMVISYNPAEHSFSINLAYTF